MPVYFMIFSLLRKSKFAEFNQNLLSYISSEADKDIADTVGEYLKYYNNNV